MNKQPINLAEGTESLLATIAKIERLTSGTEDTLEKRLQPVRNSLIKKYPVTFLLLVTVGFVFVSFGIEEFLHSQALLAENPVAVFFVGLLLLIISGSAYKRQ